ncbi:MAG: DUF3467 domain-containing protein [Aggregatilineales bacterium]
MSDQEENKPINLSVPIEWHTSETVSAKYATNIVVQRAEHEVIISFFEIYPPIILGSREEMAEQIQEITSVRAECVARIVLSPARLSEFINLLQTTNAQLGNQEKAGMDE